MNEAYIDESDLYTNGEMLQQAPMPPQSQQYDKIIQEEKVANFMSQTSPSKTLTRIDWVLKGYMYDEGSKEWKRVSNGIPDEIRMDFIQAMTPHLSEDVRMGRLDAHQINAIMSFAIEWTVDYLNIKADNFYLDKANKWVQIDEENSSLVYVPLLKDGGVQWVEERSGINYRKMENIVYKKRGLSEEDLTRISLILLSSIFYTLARSLNGVERDRVYNSLKMGDNFADYSRMEDKKNILSSFLSWK